MRNEGFDAEPLDNVTEPLLPDTEASLPGARQYQLSKDDVRLRSRKYDIALTIVMPWVSISVILLLCSFDLQLAMWIVVFICGTWAMWLVFLGCMARHGAFLFVGFLTAVSILAGVLIGLQIEEDYLDYYRTLRGGVTYKDVNAYRPEPKALVDAGALHFSPGTLVDDRSTAGFIAEGKIYCVAPVAMECLKAKQVQYWAVGKNCCEKRSHFNCGAAMTSDAPTAIIARPSEHWYSAAAEAHSLYGLTTAPEALFVSFVSDVLKAEDSMFDAAVYAVLVAVTVHFVTIVLVTLCVYRLAPAAMSPRSEEHFRRIKYCLHGVRVVDRAAKHEHVSK